MMQSKKRMECFSSMRKRQVALKMSHNGNLLISEEQAATINYGRAGIQCPFPGFENALLVFWFFNRIERISRFGFGLSAPSRRSGHHTPRKLVRWTPESVLYTGEGEGAKGGPNWQGGRALHMCALLHLCMAGRALHMCALLR